MHKTLGHRAMTITLHGVLSLPIAEGGQGLVAVTSKVMAFRLLSLRRLLYTNVS